MSVSSQASARPMIGRRVGLGLLWGLLAVAPVAAQTPAARPGPTSDPTAALLAGACLSCHSASGAGGIPIIAKTLGKDEFIAAMQAFRSNAREATIMTRIVRGYSDAELAILAAYFAK